MTFSVTVLGCSSAIPANGRNPSAQLINANEKLFLVDCAEGTQMQIRKFHIKFQRIKHIMISHLHGDHFYGLIGLITTFHLLGRKDELHLYGFPMLKEIIDLEMKASDTRLNYNLIFHEINDNGQNLIYEDDKFEVYSFPLVHSIPTCGFLFSEKKAERSSLSGPRSYAYCSDTAYTETIIPYVKNVSLIYHEATFLHEMAENARQKYHSTCLEAATIAKLAGAGKLMIGHYSARYEDITPLLEEAQSVFPETVAADDGMVLKI